MRTQRIIGKIELPERTGKTQIMLDDGSFFLVSTEDLREEPVRNALIDEDGSLFQLTR